MATTTATSATTTLEQRAVGALVGAFVGEALAVGCHWYYDRDEQVRDHGEWIDDYTTPRADRYHAGLEAGDSSQPALILEVVIDALLADAERAEYDEARFTRALDERVLARLDGEPMGGPGGYTSQAMRELYRARVVRKQPWGADSTASHADTTEGLERALAYAVRYAHAPARLAHVVASNVALTQSDHIVQAVSTAFCAVLGHAVRHARRVDARISGELMALVKARELPFHAVTTGNLAPPARGGGEGIPREGRFASPDALLTPSNVARAALDADVRVEPAWKCALLYGQPCAIFHVVPAVYYLAARFADNFELGVLHALNGGGQNQVRAMLTGALIGAHVGIDGIPPRFLRGLKRADHYVALAKRLAVHLVRDVRAQGGQ